jgi:hypothetical protein
MLKSSPIFKRNGAHLVEKMTFKKKKDYRLSKFECFEHVIYFLFVSSFEHVNFAINEKYSKFFHDNKKYYVSLVTFQTYKKTVLRSVYSLGWLL